MKFTYSILTILLFSQICFSQKEKIKQIESALSQKDGAEFASDAILLSELYFSEKMYDLASRRADDAYEKAKSIGQKELMATALNWRGKAIQQTADGKKTALNKAFKSFEESNQYTVNDNERLENLQHLKSLAEMLKRPKEAQKADYDIAVLRGENPPPLTEETGTSLFNNKKKKALEEYQKLQEEKLDALKEKDHLAKELTQLSEAQQSLRDQQETLIHILAVKETALANMSEEQIKQELMLSEQERLLDSLTFTSILDSMEISQQEMLVQQQKSDLLKQEAELSLQKTHRNFLMALAGLFIILAGGLLHRFFAIKAHNTVLEEKNKIIQAERERSENLLLNILPKAIADELKLSGGAETQHYDNATVMFVDFKGFSKISKQLTPQQLVADLDHAFRSFDSIIVKFGLEKIKTIGDAYMCAGGVPNEDRSHPVNVIKAALEIQQFLDKWNAGKSAKGEPVFEARIGIHTGPLVAGVVGSKKFAYDIWGDTVNVASRMETSCEVGRVNISDSTYDKVKDFFTCEYRGKVPAKNVGEVEMYYVGSAN